MCDFKNFVGILQYPCFLSLVCIVYFNFQCLFFICASLDIHRTLLPCYFYHLSHNKPIILFETIEILYFKSIIIISSMSLLLNQSLRSIYRFLMLIILCVHAYTYLEHFYRATFINWALILSLYCLKQGIQCTLR